MQLEALKSPEMPGGIKVVIADDEERIAAWAVDSWVSILQSTSPIGPAEVYSAKNGNDLLARALGLTERAADVVVLDNRFKENYGSWRPTEEMLSLLAQKQGVPFEPIKPPDRGNSIVSGVMPDDLYHPSALDFSLLLRYLKFTGKIIVASGGPPEGDLIKIVIERLNDHLKQYDLKVGEKPIDGVVTKPSKYNESDYATKITERGWWDYTNVKVEGYEDAFRALISAM